MTEGPNGTKIVIIISYIMIYDIMMIGYINIAYNNRLYYSLL